ncbi:MAG TPA: SDR family oxidoreductase, partial [Spirochaetia bacterium]|nr:SDR family oxidoreductase [Spirochaetia bacterium]
RAIVAQLAEHGAKMVIACDMNEAALSWTKQEIRVTSRVANVTSPEDIAELVAGILAEFGSIDVLINNAGITRDNLIQKITDEDWEAVIAVNLKGPFNMMRAVVPAMIEQDGGSVVNISSVVGLDGNIGQTNYSATKAGVVGMTKTWAKELARKGAKIRVNAVAPGYIRTPMVETVPEKIIDSIVSKTVLGRLGEAEDVAKAVLFLSSDAASFITGQVLRVDGGLVL